MKSTTQTREIRLQLAFLLDKLGQLQNTETWEQVSEVNPKLQELFQNSQECLDSLWWEFRQTTKGDKKDV